MSETDALYEEIEKLQYQRDSERAEHKRQIKESAEYCALMTDNWNQAVATCTEQARQISDLKQRISELEAHKKEK